MVKMWEDIVRALMVSGVPSCISAVSKTHLTRPAHRSLSAHPYKLLTNIKARWGSWEKGGEWNHHLSKDGHILLLRTCRYITSHGKKKDFADAIKWRIMKWKDDPGLSSMFQCHHKGPYKREAGGSKSKQEIWFWKHWGQEPKNTDGSRMWKRQGSRISPKACGRNTALPTCGQLLLN